MIAGQAILVFDWPTSDNGNNKHKEWLPLVTAGHAVLILDWATCNNGNNKHKKWLPQWLIDMPVALQLAGCMSFTWWLPSHKRNYELWKAHHDHIHWAVRDVLDVLLCSLQTFVKWLTLLKSWLVFLFVYLFKQFVIVCWGGGRGGLQSAVWKKSIGKMNGKQWVFVGSNVLHLNCTQLSLKWYEWWACGVMYVSRHGNEVSKQCNRKKNQMKESLYISPCEDCTCNIWCVFIIQTFFNVYLYILPFLAPMVALI